MLALPLAWAAIRKGASAAIDFVLRYPLQIAAALLLAIVLVQEWRIKGALAERDESRAEADVLDSALQACRAANATASSTVDALRTANAELADAWAESQRTAQEAAAEFKTWKEAQVQRDAAARKREREVIYRDSACDLLGKVDLAAGCPALADRLRHSRAGH